MPVIVTWVRRQVKTISDENQRFCAPATLKGRHFYSTLAGIYACKSYDALANKEQSIHAQGLVMILQHRRSAHTSSASPPGRPRAAGPCRARSARGQAQQNGGGWCRRRPALLNFGADVHSIVGRAGRSKCNRHRDVPPSNRKCIGTFRALRPCPKVRCTHTEVICDLFARCIICRYKRLISFVRY